MSNVRIAQIGISRHSHGQMIATSLKKLSNHFEVVGFALPENEREKFPDKMWVFEGLREMTVEEILTDPTIEAVAIETEEIYLHKYALLAAQHGKHIHMEKPGGLKLSDFEKLIDTVRTNGTVFHVGYMYRYNPCVKALMDAVKQGELGDILSVEAQMNCFQPKETRDWLSTFPGGQLFFLGCHLIDLVLQIQGKPQAILPLSCATHTDGVTAANFGMAVLQYENGVSFVKTNAAEVGGFARRQLVVVGSKKTVELKPFEMWCEDGQYTTQTVYDNGGDWTDCGTTTRTAPFDRYDPMMEAFADMVEGKAQNPYTIDYELELYKTLLACCGV